MCLHDLWPSVTGHSLASPLPQSQSVGQSLTPGMPRICSNLAKLFTGEVFIVTSSSETFRAKCDGRGLRMDEPSPAGSTQPPFWISPQITSLTKKNVCFNTQGLLTTPQLTFMGSQVYACLYKYKKYTLYNTQKCWKWVLMRNRGVLSFLKLPH